MYEVGVRAFDYYGGIAGGDTVVTDLAVDKEIGFDVVACTRHSDGEFGMLAENLRMNKTNDAGQFEQYELVETYEPGACAAPPAGDVNGDCRVDIYDLLLLTENWLGGTAGAGW